MKGKASWQSVSAIFRLAEKAYPKLNKTNKLQVVGKKANGSVFLNSNPSNIEPVCWNCGKKGHSDNKCHQTRNPESRKSCQKEYNNERKGEHHGHQQSR